MKSHCRQSSWRGLGTRLRPLTLSTPKCMVKIGSRPFISYLLGKVKDHGFTNVHICTGYLSERVKEFVGDGGRFGLSVTYSDEEQAPWDWRRAKERPFISGTGIFADTGRHVQCSGPRRTCGALRGQQALVVVTDHRSHTGIFNTNIDAKSGLVTYYSKDKKEVGGERMNCVDIGTYVFGRDFLFKFFPDEKAFSLEERVFPQLIAARSLYGHNSRQVFYDMGTPESLDSLRGVLNS